MKKVNNVFLKKKPNGKENGQTPPPIKKQKMNQSNVGDTQIKPQINGKNDEKSIGIMKLVDYDSDSDTDTNTNSPIVQSESNNSEPISNGFIHNEQMSTMEINHNHSKFVEPIDITCSGQAELLHLGALDHINVYEKKTVIKPETVKCIFCLNLIYNCVSVQPCLHSFCARCLLEWRSSKTRCPKCDIEIEGVARNHQLQSLVNLYALYYPIELKTEQNRIDDDRRVTQRKSVLFSSSTTRVTALNHISNGSNCRFCNYPNPADPNHIMPVNMHGLICTLNMTHTRCKCCGVYIPDYPNTSVQLTSEPTSTTITEINEKMTHPIEKYEFMEENQSRPIFNPVLNRKNKKKESFQRITHSKKAVLDSCVIGELPPYTCKMCQGEFCNLLFGSCKGCKFGCLHRFSDFLFNSNLNPFCKIMAPFVPDNFYELNLLKSYITEMNKSVPDMYTDILILLGNNNVIQLPYHITGDSYLCVKCSHACLIEAVYQYRLNIPATQLPGGVLNRPNCSYGRNCRNQSINPQHAAFYNHVCEPFSK